MRLRSQSILLGMQRFRLVIPADPRHQYSLMQQDRLYPLRRVRRKAQPRKALLIFSLNRRLFDLQRLLKEAGKVYCFAQLLFGLLEMPLGSCFGLEKKAATFNDQAF
ncbi:hypothetical protein CSR02_14745 [Acetobacter pomorum]|uniref:Uncharacterized protein n=1 Tax=Acetobacter pomorum TaxID=65959 RepID=A0A2G4R8Q1_9PROT|nr:hypothetical protein CSR02_14745 [Acetobacter pomorum]